MFPRKFGQKIRYWFTVWQTDYHHVRDHLIVVTELATGVSVKFENEAVSGFLLTQSLTSETEAVRRCAQ